MTQLCLTTYLYGQYRPKHVVVHYIVIKYTSCDTVATTYLYGQYRPKHVVVHYIVIKYTSCDTVVFDYIPFSKFHTHTTGMTHFLDYSVYFD